jgi:AbrB family looped-hinge helix DNA binding protein
MRAKLNRDGHITLPAGVRKGLAVQPGDEVLMGMEDDRLVMRKAPAAIPNRMAEFAGPSRTGYAGEHRRERDASER